MGGERHPDPTHVEERGMTRDMLLALALRCEKASGPDWNLDAEIWHATDTEKAECFDRKDAPAFTASLDAALTLVPEPLDWLIRSRCHSFRHGHYAHIMAGDVNTTGRTMGECWAITPALALCAASLRARAEAQP